MIFYFFPLGISRINLRHVFLAQVFYWMLIYRFLAAIAFPELQVKIIAYTVAPQVNLELATALYQSLISPFILPDLIKYEHTVLTVIGSVGIIVFWMIFGSSLEMRFKKPMFMGAFALATVLAMAVALIPAFSVNPVYWIGQGVTFFFLGATFTLFLEDDVKVFYHNFTIFGTHNHGTLEFPSPIFSFILLLVLAAPTLMHWYPVEKAIDLPLRHGMIPALGWVCLLTAAGAVTGLIWQSVAPSERRGI